MKTVVLDEFYQIIETDSRQVSLFWKGVHIGIFVAVAACGLITAYSFSRLMDSFGHNCILYANLKFTNVSQVDYLVGRKLSTTESPNAPILIDQGLTEWGAKGYCNFAHFTPIMSFIIAVIFGTFFMVVGRGGAGYESDVFSNPWQIVIPALVMSITFFFIILASTIVLADGLVQFCYQFKGQLDNTECVSQIAKYTSEFNEQNLESNFLLYEQLAENSSYVSVLLWLMQFVMLLLRLCSIVDFDVYLTSIVQKEEEILENVIDFHDDPILTTESVEDVTEF